VGARKRRFRDLLAEHDRGAEKLEELALLPLRVAVSAIDDGHPCAELAESVGGGEA
jgi:hypothetical protein